MAATVAGATLNGGGLSTDLPEDTTRPGKVMGKGCAPCPLSPDTPEQGDTTTHNGTVSEGPVMNNQEKNVLNKQETKTAEETKIPVDLKGSEVIAKPEQVIAKPEQVIAKPEQVIAKPEQVIAKPEQEKKDEEKSKSNGTNGKEEAVTVEEEVKVEVKVEVKEEVKEEPLGPDDVVCDSCIESPRRALKSCLTCLVSYCDAHLRPHLENSKFQNHRLVEPLRDIERRTCESHKWPLDLFCCPDSRCICQDCVTEDHKGHKTMTVVEARSQIQCSCTRHLLSKKPNRKRVIVDHPISDKQDSFSTDPEQHSED